MDEFQRRGMTFPLNIETRHKNSQFFALMDTGTMCSCINYKAFRKLKNSTRVSFEELCEQQHEAFSKNNKDIGHTQLIEMEIDTGDSLPVAQSPYTLPLKHYDWVHQEIETLEKSGVIERSLLRWASPVIVVPKKSAPDKPPWRRLCVDYWKVNALQPEVK